MNGGFPNMIYMGFGVRSGTPEVALSNATFAGPQVVINMQGESLKEQISDLKEDLENLENRQRLSSSEYTSIKYRIMEIEKKLDDIESSIRRMKEQEFDRWLRVILALIALLFGLIIFLLNKLFVA